MSVVVLCFRSMGFDDFETLGACLILGDLEVR